MAESLLESFLVAINIKVDDNAKRQTMETLQKIEKGLVQLSVVAAGVATGVTAGLLEVAKAFDSIYYASQRTGSSVKEMQSFKAAASQMGASASEAQSAIEGMARAVRENPGYKGLLRNLGATDTNDMTKALNQIAPRLAAMPLAQAEQFAKELSIPENVLLAMRKVEEFRERQARFSAKYSILGFDPDKAAKDARELSNSFNDLLDTFAKIGDRTASGLFKDLQPQIERLNAFLLAHGDEISKIMIKIGDALFKMFNYVVEHLPDIDKFVDSMGGWATVLDALALVISVGFVARVGSLLASLTGLASLSMPAWLLAMLGITAYTAGNAAKGAFDKAFDAVTGPSSDDVHKNMAMGPIERAKKIWDERPAWLGGGGAKNGVPLTSDAGNLTKLIDAEAKRAGIDPRIMQGIRAGESGHRQNGDPRGAYDSKDDAVESSWGPFQLNRRRGLGVQFEKETGLDVRDPKTIPAQARWVAEFIAKGGSLGNWMGYHGPRDANPRWGDSGYVPTPAKPAAPAYGNHMGAPVPVPSMKALGDPMKGLGGFNPDALRPLFTSPLGGTGVNDNSRSVTVQDHSSTTIHGVSDPTSAAAQVGAAKDRRSSMLLKGVQSAIG